MRRDAMMVLRIPSEVRDQLDEVAKREQRSRSNMALRIITEWLEQHGVAQQPRRRAPKRRV